MQLRFQLTFDDLLDNYGRVSARALKHAHSKRPRMFLILRLVLWLDVIALALLSALFALVGLTAGPRELMRSFSHVADTQAGTMVALLPWAGLQIALISSMVLMRRPRHAMAGMILAWLFWIAVGSVFVYAGWPNWEPRFQLDGYTFWDIAPFRRVDFIAWAFMSFFWWLLTISITRQPHRLWRDQPNMHRPKTLDVTETGFTLSDTVSRLSYDWPAIDKVVDTPTAILMYVNPVQFYIVPKRAFTSDAELDAFWRLVNEKGESPAAGFRVLRTNA